MSRVERAALARAVDDARRWHRQACELEFLASHAPITPFHLPPYATVLLNWTSRGVPEKCAEVVRGLSIAERARPTVRGARKELVAAVLRGHGNFVCTAGPAMLERLLMEARTHYNGEAEALARMLSAVADAGGSADEALLAVAHMPLTRAGVISDTERKQLTAHLTTAQVFAGPSAELPSRELCHNGGCEAAHSTARAVAELHERACVSTSFVQVKMISARVEEQFRQEAVTSQKRITEVLRWPTLVASAREIRAEAPGLVSSRLNDLVKKALPIELGGRATWLLPLTDAEGQIENNLRLLRDGKLTKSNREQLVMAETRAGRLRELIQQLQPSGKCFGDQRCAGGHDKLAELLIQPEAVTAGLKRLATFPAAAASDITRIEMLLDPTLRFREYFDKSWIPYEILPASLTENVVPAVEAVLAAERARKKAGQEARSAADAVRARDVESALREMPVETLRKASTDSIRVAPLEAAGLHTVWDVLAYCEATHLGYLDGIGPASAHSIEQSARRLHEGVRDEMPVRIDVKGRHSLTKALLFALRQWDAARRFTPTTDELALAKGLASIQKATRRRHCVLGLVGAKEGEPVPLSRLLEGLLARSGRDDGVDVWKDFLSRPSDYFGLLTELGFLTEDAAKMHGDLPDEIVAAVRGLELRKNHLRASLRMYQAFAAKFSVVQEKVVLGDEMGLGKTVEALAVLAHLKANGRTHFLVVCPAAVVSNWMREVGKHTDLRAFRLHGNQWDRRHAANSWVRQGGIAVTTYDLLGWATEYADGARVDTAIFDEAHYVKNPSAKRSINTQRVVDACRYAVLMTGTPLENNVQEFRNIVGYLRPDLADTAPEYLPSAFRKHVAPAYLRRNQEDVLSELPELVEVEEWLPMSATDTALYTEAVAEGNFMLMRRAAMLDTRSEKLQRLIEIVREAEANERRVIVFSYFREVLELLARELPGNVFGPITGSVPAAQRQVVVDQFSSAPRGAVLVSQIAAGGVGLNIQAASVVVICEPQLKPTSETQAIARAHRMGQTNTVQVHRLLSEGAVDERIRELLAEKLAIFNEFARSSVMKDQAPDAVDITDAELARQVVAAERQRLLGAETVSTTADRE